MELAPNCHKCSCCRCCLTRLHPLPHFTSHTASVPAIVMVGSTLMLHLCICVCIQVYSSSMYIISITDTSKSSFLEYQSLVCFLITLISLKRIENWPLTAPCSGNEALR